MPSIELGPTTPVGATDNSASRLWSDMAASSATHAAAGAGANGGTGAADVVPPAIETSVSTDAGEPPVDTDRVALIRHAVENGTYPIIPARIADAMIAAGMLLRTGSHDKH